MALFASGLLPASFRGVPFAVRSSGIGGGRRQAVHEYPGRDVPWVEDMGRAGRRFRFEGFIVDGDVVFLGGPIELQRALLIAALEKQGPGSLTHPTLGILTVSVTTWRMEEDLGAGRMSSIGLEFVESGSQSFPSLLTSSTGLLTAANVGVVALAADGVRALALATQAGVPRAAATTTVSAWSGQVIELGRDATALHRLAAQLQGNFGRFAGGGNVGLNGSNQPLYPADTTIATLTSIASAQRQAIAAAAAALDTIVATDDLTAAIATATAISTLVNCLAAACADPLDAIRLLERLIAYDPTGGETGNAAGDAVGTMMRRAAACALITVAGAYQPSSADDAASMAQEIGTVLDDQATIAADAGDDQSYNALRAGRGAVVQDLRQRGATLSEVATFHIGQSMPALALAQRLYGDASRADQLITQTVPISPLFMPTDFRALAA